LLTLFLGGWQETEQIPFWYQGIFWKFV
jgi:hypothetical protein